VLELTRFKERVDLSSDALTFYYSDIHDSNFLINKAGQIYVIDFQEAGFLPESFMSFVLHGARLDHPLAVSISNKITLRKSNNLQAMSRVCGIFTASSARIGKNRSV
jgi:hypothetical protein